MYGDREYWECRYHDDPIIGHCQRKGVLSNEWYLQYEMLKTLLHEHISADDQVLIPGCGLSLLCEEMAADGFRSLLAVDYSETCIQTMQTRGAEAHQNNVTYRIMDVTALQLQVQVKSMLMECARVLRAGGRFICISHSEPEDREHLLTGPELPWELLEHVELMKNKAIFHAYILQKV